MLKSECSKWSKNFDFFSHGYISSWFWCVIFFKSFYTMEEKIWRCEVMDQSAFCILKKFSQNLTFDHFKIKLHQQIQQKNHIGSLCCSQLVSEVHIIFELSTNVVAEAMWWPYGPLEVNKLFSKLCRWWLVLPSNSLSPFMLDYLFTCLS